MPTGSLTRRRRWPIYLPTIVLVVLALGWTGFWFFAASTAGTELDRAFAREAAQGREIACGERRIEGYPFRIEIRCANARLALRTPDGPLVFEAPDFVAVAQLPVPTHVVAELRGPLTLGRSPGSPVLSLQFTGAQASLHGGPRALDRASLVLREPVLSRVEGGVSQIGIDADSIELHVRRSPAGPDTWDGVAKFVNAAAPAVDSSLAKAPSTVELQVSLSGTGELARGLTPDALRAFAQTGGKLHVALLRAEQGDVVAEARGDLGLDPQGRANGDFTVAVAGMQQLLAKASEAGLSWLWTLLPLGKPGKIGDRPAATYAVRVASGAVSVGPLPFGFLPPVF